MSSRVATAGSGVANHAEKSESARVGDRRDEFGAGDASHAGQDDGVPAVKQVTDPRGQMTPQVLCLLCSGLRKGTTGVRYAHPLAHLPVLISEPASLVQDHRADHEGAKQNCQCTDRVSSHGCKLRVEDRDNAATVSCQGRSIR